MTEESHRMSVRLISRFRTIMLIALVTLCGCEAFDTERKGFATPDAVLQSQDGNSLNVWEDNRTHIVVVGSLSFQAKSPQDTSMHEEVALRWLQRNGMHCRLGQPKPRYGALLQYYYSCGR